MERIWSNIKKRWLSLFLGLIFSIIFISFVYSVQRDPNLSQALVAFGTLILALVTSLTILNSREQEKRDRKERLLNEIIEWATEATRTAIFRQTIISHELWETMLKYKYSISRGKYIEGIVLSSFPSLLSLFRSTLSKLDSALLITQKFAEKNANKSDLLDCEKQVAESVEKLIEEAARIKTKDIGKEEEEEENVSKEVETTASRELALKDIEEHMKRQDKQTMRVVYLTGAIFGVSIILVATSLWIGRIVLSASAFYWQYIFLLIVGFGFMFWCWWKLSKVK